ncbi:hypothetical protein BCR39DRAFT_534124 [Naematelia encephala]|uniref:Uncharacterized protein n=1 Tax=Naematelia encephala TaxID=71784 RepID=A0A1Y2B1V9_9TREE|nr:hypothetical protein BCR39DRAFT_534124 [Naematelia encephala]
MFRSVRIPPCINNPLSFHSFHSLPLPSTPFTPFTPFHSVQSFRPLTATRLPRPPPGDPDVLPPCPTVCLLLIFSFSQDRTLPLDLTAAGT